MITTEPRPPYGGRAVELTEDPLTPTSPPKIFAQYYELGWTLTDLMEHTHLDYPQVRTKVTSGCARLRNPSETLQAPPKPNSDGQSARAEPTTPDRPRPGRLHSLSMRWRSIASGAWPVGGRRSAHRRGGRGNPVPT